MHLSPARPGLLCLWLIFKFFLSFFFPALSLCCCVQALCFSEWGLLSSVVPSLLIAVASLAVEHGLQVYSLQQLRRMGSVVVAHGLSCPAACGILLDQGSNSYPLHWQAGSYPLDHQKALWLFLLKYSRHIEKCTDSKYKELSQLNTPL